MPIRSCQVIASINRNTGGTAVGVTRLAASLARLGIESHLFALDYNGLGSQEIAAGVRIHCLPASKLAQRFRGFSSAARRALFQVTNRSGINLIHNHGLWMFPNLYARQAARRFALPLIISPRGMLEAWSLRRSRLKKLLVWHWFEKDNLRTARLIHATSEAEVAALRTMGLTQPIALISDGVDLEDMASLPPRESFCEKHPELRGRKWLLFLSRLHPKKGVTELIAAWRQLHARFLDWHLIIAGPCDDGYGKCIRHIVAESGLSARLTLTGMLADDDKRVALGYADLFVLPTHSENFGIAVAESLAFGVPVITTKAAPWSELEYERCGWWIEDRDVSLISTLDRALRLTSEERAAMGKRGRRLMERKYSWKRVGEQMLATYLWCCGRGERPACVQSDQQEV